MPGPKTSRLCPKRRSTRPRTTTSRSPLRTSAPTRRRKERLGRLADYFAQQKVNFLGNLGDGNARGAKDLGRFLDYSTINVGDPFRDSNFTPHSRAAERAVFGYYARLWGGTLRQPDGGKPVEPHQHWGYVLSMGGTEGNVYAMWNARDYLAGKLRIANGPRAAAGRAPAEMWVDAQPAQNNENASGIRPTPSRRRA
ncbi:hypothetical protein [Saccharothrix hoggarensis]|uniref:Uncharacterized protein n=1 Tax=Saccharothrix hoggarensis TaxID=913853 RepID=A0ABW3QL44_9PSEU